MFHSVPTARWKLVLTAACGLAVGLCPYSAVRGVEPPASAGRDKAGLPERDLPERDLSEGLVAHWKFDEQGSEAVVRNASSTAGLDMTAPHPLSRIPGVHGNALNLAGETRLACPLVSRSGTLSEITLVAWTRPADVQGYREILRQECPERLLFSFQNSGSILSLGLNIGGYVECDAKTDSAQVLDGAWHHCAATFDGQVMRVYLDGAEIGSLSRPGRIATTDSAPAFVGSSSGQGEFFQGGLDDLRVYFRALTPDQITRLYRAGAEALDARARQIDAQLGDLFVPGSSFAESLARTSQNLVERGVHRDRELVSALLTRLKARYPEDYETFLRWTGTVTVHTLGAAIGKN